MPATCPFCGAVGKLTGEHVLGDWLSRIGLKLDPVALTTGPLNRIGRNIGVTPPFNRKVRDVCGPCNNGWMSRLEDVAKRVLTPLILGEPGNIAQAGQGRIAAWLEKTVLVAMLMSSEEEREGGYSLPAQEYRALYDRRAAMEPLPASQVGVETSAGLAQLWPVIQDIAWRHRQGAATGLHCPHRSRREGAVRRVR
ncbi:hypothetical protein HC031_19615 [Planosporangium thailandense]|uniref:Uncharacterized protein n=1 Tax=Planosporangium thailandense TaxID=765197 RepID=A0ABX0Y1D7_9ACTN|nr:hypothetical protein [Planosporangium thailandense]NJC71906.1 hypothetical protein [Planosporangium thailandense]